MSIVITLGALIALVFAVYFFVSIHRNRSLSAPTQNVIEESQKLPSVEHIKDRIDWFFDVSTETKIKKSHFGMRFDVMSYVTYEKIRVLASRWDQVSAEDQQTISLFMDETIPALVTAKSQLTSGVKNILVLSPIESKIIDQLNIVNNQLSVIEKNTDHRIERGIAESSSFLTSKFNYNNSLTIEDKKPRSGISTLSTHARTLVSSFQK